MKSIPQLTHVIVASLLAFQLLLILAEEVMATKDCFAQTLHGYIFYAKNACKTDTDCK